MPTIDEAKKLLAWMRSEGLSHVRLGDIELSLENPMVPAEPPDTSGPEYDPRKKYLSIEDDPDLYGEREAPTFPDEGGS